MHVFLLLNFRIKSSCPLPLIYSALLSLLLFISFHSYSQSKEDSLKQRLSLEKSPALQSTILNRLSLETRSVDFTRSREYALRARAIAEENNLPTEIARSYINSGTSYYFEGSHERALADYMKALEVSEKLGDKAGIIDALNEIGTLEKKNGHLDASEESLERALKLSKGIEDSVRVANSLNNLGHCLEMKGNTDQAMKLYQESTVIKEKQKDWYAASFNYDNMANLLSKQGRFREAEDYYQKEIKILNELKDKTNYAIAVNNLGEMFSIKGENAKAKENFLKSLRISKEIGFKDLTRHIYQMLSVTFEKEKDYQNAYEYYVKAAELKDSIFNEQKSKQLLDLQTRYETEKKENQIILLQQENKIKDFGLRQNKLFILGLVLALLTILIVGLLSYNRMKLKQSVELETTRATLREGQLNAVIKSQEEERRRFADDLHDGLGQIISALRLNLSRDNIGAKSIEHALNLLNEMNVEIRNIAFNLMPQALITDGLESALQQLAARINRSGNVNVSVNTFNLTGQISSDYKIAIYRICQEWVNNVLKYSGANQITIQLVLHPDELVITIEDNGSGFDITVLENSQGNGWKNINSRTALVKGHVEIDSAQGRKGSTLLLSIPSFTLYL